LFPSFLLHLLEEGHRTGAISPAHLSCHFRRRWLTSVCCIFRSGVNQCLEYCVRRRSGVNLLTAVAVASSGCRLPHLAQASFSPPSMGPLVSSQFAETAKLILISRARFKTIQPRIRFGVHWVIWPTDRGYRSLIQFESRTQYLKLQSLS
jgi:hypothetical protein